MTDHPQSRTSLLASLFAVLKSLTPAEQQAYLMSLPLGFREYLVKAWREYALPHQREPLLAQGGLPWTTWVILGGRGAGKTRAGAEWVRMQALDPSARLALIGETGRDVREVMIEGVSGLLSVHEYRD